MTRPILALAALACGAAPLLAQGTPTVIYSNTDTLVGPAAYALDPPMDGYWIGDDLHVVGFGLLEGLRFSLCHASDALGHGDPLMSVDAEIAFAEINNPDDVFAGPITLHLSFGPDGLPVGDSALLEATALAELGYYIDRPELVAKLRYINKAGADPDKKPGALGQLMYDPPTIGSSGPRFWFDTTVATPPGTEHDWYWFGGEPGANFYWEITVLDAGPITFPVTVLPDLGIAATFEVDPADDSDPPQGGYGNPLTTPTHLVYDPPEELMFRNPALTVGGQPRTFLGWFFHGPDAWLDTSSGPPAYETTYPVGSDQYTELQVAFNTELAVAAEKKDGAPVTGLPVKFTDRKTVTPTYPGDPIKDIEGQGDGVTPLLRKWNPVDLQAPLFDYLQWVCVYVPQQLGDGTPFLKYVLTATDGMVSDFFNPDYPGRVCLRVDAFVSAIAVYGPAFGFELGDANCDGDVDAFDIDDFVLGLTDLAAWQALYPDCDVAVLDINCDGSIDAFDIDPFVELLTGG